MKKYGKYTLGFITGSLLSFFVTTRCYAAKQVPNENTDRLGIIKVIETINAIEEVWVGDKKLNRNEYYENALRGIFKGLDDPYSEYLTKEEYKDLNEGLDGQYSGVGMSIKKVKGEYMEVSSPFIGGPAFKARIQIGDKVSKVDGKDIINNSAVEVSKMLKGPKGTKVTLEIIRKGYKKPINVTLIRDNIKIDNVEYKMLENNIGYISLLQFGTNIAIEIEDAIKDLESKGMKKLILDLRTNPGGSLKEAIDLASLFVKQEYLLSLVQKGGKEQKFYKSRPTVYNGNMVILVNKGSASASEILTGILKDYNRATIIGDTTYGKGVAQNIIQFNTGDALKITIAKYYTPKKYEINKKGIEPNIYINMDAIIASKGYGSETNEAKENRLKEIKEILKEVYGEKKANEIVEKGDTQLKAAIDYLNGKKVVSDKKKDKK